MEWCQVWEPGLPFSPVTIGQGEQQHFIWSSSDPIWGSTIGTDNGKLASIEWCQVWEPSLPLSPGTLSDVDKQQLIWGHPDVSWGGPSPAPPPPADISTLNRVTRSNWHILDRVRKRRFGQRSTLNSQVPGTGLTLSTSTGQIDLQAGTLIELGGFLKIASDIDLTDNSGGSATSTIAAMTNVDTLTDSTGGSADDTVANVGTAVTGVDGTANNAASKADVDTRLTGINNNFKELTDQIITQKALNTVLINAVASLAEDNNDLKSKMRTSGILDS